MLKQESHSPVEGDLTFLMRSPPMLCPINIIGLSFSYDSLANIQENTDVELKPPLIDGGT